MINNPIIYRLLFTPLLTTERRLTGWQFLVVDLPQTLFNTGINDEIFQQYEKQDSFRQTHRVQQVCIQFTLTFL